MIAAEFRHFSCLLMISLLCFLSSTSVTAAITVDFDQDEYIVFGPGDTIQAHIVIDGDQLTSELEPIEDGLFSFGVLATFDATKVTVVDASSMSVATELDHFGFSDGALIEVTSMTAGAKGNIGQQSDPQSSFKSTTLIELELTNLATAEDAYTLRLVPFRTLGENEQLFVSGTGEVLDDEIVFGSARVRVVPEPSGLLFCLLPFVFIFRNQRCA